MTVNDEISEVDNIIGFLEERLASCRIQALKEEKGGPYRMIINGECIGYASALEYIKSLRLG